MGKIMDRETAEHFYRWLDHYISKDEQHEVEQAIHALLKDDPELLNDHGWPELREMARVIEKEHPDTDCLTYLDMETDELV